MNVKAQEARNSTVNLEFVNGEEVIQILTEMFGADEVTRIARKHEQAQGKQRPKRPILLGSQTPEWQRDCQANTSIGGLRALGYTAKAHYEGEP